MGDNASVRKEEKAKKAEKVAKEKAEKKEKAETIKQSKPKKEREVIIVHNVEKDDKLEFLEEEKIVVHSTPQYSNTHNDSYVYGRSVGQSYTYGDNFLYDYYNNGKTVNNTVEVEADRVSADRSASPIGLKEQSDQIIKAYNDMPTQLKKYIIDKILSKTME